MLRAVAVPRTYRVEELSADSGVSVSMIRWYIKQGILPHASAPGGRNAYYTDEHLRRLRAIQRERDNRRTSADWRERFSGVQA